MNEVEPEPLEENYVSLLAAGEQALAVGATLSIAGAEELPPEVQVDLKRDLACVELLRQVLPLRPGVPPTNKSASEPSWTDLGRFQIRRELGQGLIARASSQSADDLSRLLHRRLLVLAVLVAASQSVIAIKEFVRPPAVWEPVLSETLSTSLAWEHLTIAAVVWVVAAMLWRRKALSLRQLRAAELGILTMLVAHSLWDVWGFNTWAPVEVLTQPQFGNALVNTISLQFVLLIIGYGVFVPNSWRRCLIVLSVITVAAVAVAVASLPLHSAPEGFLADYLMGWTIYLGIATALAVFGAQGLSILRRQVREAQRLGQYVLRQRLGGGGMGEVFRAEHALLRRPAAIKLIRPDRAGDPKNLARFEREVQATATLTHPNTIQIYDYGHAEDGTFYYVMEYLEGLTLQELVKAHGPLPPARAIFLLRQVCLALREAHSIGLIHRDIKPSNIIVCERGGVGDVAKLLDFGLVRGWAGNTDDASLTHDGAIAGTPAYMSPEQAGAKDHLDARSDIYSMGALAYFLLTGRAPFESRSAVQVLAAHMYEPPAPLTQHRPDLPSDLEAVVLRCLAKEPPQRYAEADDLEAALSACQNAGGWTVQQAASWWRCRADANSRVGARGAPR